MAGEVGACAVSHLEEVSNDGIESMIQSDTIGVLLPTTAYILRLNPPPARKMIDKGKVHVYHKSENFQSKNIFTNRKI